MNAISAAWPSGFEETSCKLKETAQQSESKAIFLNRVIKAAIAYAEQTSVVEAASASSDYGVLLTILESPEALDLLRRNDPLIDARLRGLEVKKQLLQAEGGCYTGEQVAKILSISRQAVDKRRKKGKLIGISQGEHKYLYPAWQFTDTGKTLDGLENVLVELKNFDPWMQMIFMLSSHIRLQEKTPLEALRNGEIDKVLISGTDIRRTWGTLMEGSPGHHPPPPNDLNNRQLPLINWSELKILYRVHQTQYDPIYFGKKAVYRFDDPQQEYGILYAGNDEFCAFRETIFPSQITGPYINYKSVTKIELKKRRLSLITLSRPLKLIDLTGAGLTHIDADGRLATEENYSLSQKWSRAFWEHPSQPDGLYYRSRYDPSRFCFALYNRVESILSVKETIDFLQRSFRSRLTEIIDTYQYALID